MMKSLDVQGRTVKYECLQQRGIIIEKTHELKDSIFCTEYQQANSIINDIICSFSDTKMMETQQASQIVQKLMKSISDSSLEDAYMLLQKKKNSSDDIYNVVPFIGKRGTGKSSAMLTFMEALKTYDSQKILGDSDATLNFEKQNISFVVLPYIDASTLQKTENIMEIILARILKYLLDGQNNDTRGSQEKLKELYQRIDRFYRNLLNLRRENVIDEGESALRKLRALTSSYSTAQEFRTIVLEFQNYVRMQMEKNFSRKIDNVYLIIAIDDIDLYESGAPKDDMYSYELLELIYQYLKIPGVIVLTAFNDALLKLNCRQYIKRKFNVDDKMAAGICNQFLSKIISRDQRIYMPDFEMVDYAVEDQVHIELPNGHFLSEIKRENEKNPTIKEFLLNYIAKRTGIYFDACGVKTHFFEFRNLRDLSNFIHFLDDLKVENTTENRRWNYMRLLSYIYNQFVSERLYIGEELTYFNTLMNVSISRRSRDLLEYIRDYRSRKVSPDSRYYERRNDSNSGWRYSYGELLHNLYYSTRCDAFSKEFVHCILASYSTVLNRNYYEYREEKNRLAEIELKRVLGTSIAGKWANKILPTVEYTSYDSVAKKSIPDHVDVASVSIVNLEKVFQITIPDEVMKAFQFLLKDSPRATDWHMDKESIREMRKNRRIVGQFLNSLELLGMFFTSGDSKETTVCNFQFEIRWDGEENSENGRYKLIANSNSSVCFNILNFAVNSYVWGEYFDSIHKTLIRAVENAPQIKNLLFKPDDIEALKQLFEKKSLKKQYKQWAEQYGPMAIPIQNFDLVYNLIKRQADGITYNMPKSIDLDDMWEYCCQIYENIASALKSQDTFYRLSGTQAFSKIFNKCPFVQYFGTSKKSLQEQPDIETTSRRSNDLDMLNDNLEQIGKNLFEVARIAQTI